MCARNKNTNKGTFYTQEQSVWAPDLIQLLCLELDFRLKVSQADEKSFPFFQRRLFSCTRRYLNESEVKRDRYLETKPVATLYVAKLYFFDRHY
ncbi:hypothetical protein ACU8KH_04245 [Lachancea thermotolerans]